MINVDEFVKKHLPEVLKGRTTLDCFFTTYREVRGYRPGMVPIEKPGLSIRVSDGGSQSWVPFLLLVATSDPEPGRDEARQQLSDAIGRANIPTEGDKTYLLVVYAGLMAFDETIAFVREVRKSSPNAVIIVVTYDCDVWEKSYKLDPLVKNGTINFAVTNYDCGGRDSMAAILNGIINNWPVSTG